MPIRNRAIRENLPKYDDWKIVLTNRIREGLDPRPKGWPEHFGGWA